MRGEYSPYFFLALFAAVGIAFALVPLGLARLWAHLFSPAKPGEQKNAVYECGLETKGGTAVQFKSEYYLYAILFLVFDVETIFLLPFAVTFLDVSFAGFLAVMLFVLLLVEGLAWAWMKGVLSWR